MFFGNESKTKESWVPSIHTIRDSDSIEEWGL